MGHDFETHVRATIRGVLREMGLLPSPQHKTGPRVLFVVHGGSPRQEEAMAQIKAMEQVAGKTSLYLRDADQFCGCEPEVKEQTGARCLLGQVSGEALDRVWGRADWVVMPTLPLPVAARAASLTGPDQCLLLKGLLGGKKMLIARDAFRYPGVALAPALEERIAGVMDTLAGFGATPVPLGDLAQAFARKAQPVGVAAPPAQEPAQSPALAYVSARQVREALTAGEKSLLVAAKGVIGPLARDLAREGGLALRREDER